MRSADALTVIGAGPAGLTAAILACRAGRKVIVYERRHDVGGRFHGDFQGLENWSTDGDVLDEIRALGIEVAFPVIPFKEQVCFGPDGRERVFRSSSRPFYYLVRRGPGPDTLDFSLKEQALAAGAEIRFGETVPRPPAGSVIAWGPRCANALAVGYLFETDLPDGSFAVFDDRLAPQGYAYLLIAGGRATLATCLWRDYHDEASYLERTVEFFQQKVGFSMGQPRRFGSAVSTHLSPPGTSEHVFWAGEASGAQDALWGFGIRYAMLSGKLAASFCSRTDPRSYRRLWEKMIGGPLRASFVNRYLYGAGGKDRLPRASVVAVPLAEPGAGPGSRLQAVLVEASPVSSRLQVVRPEDGERESEVLLRLVRGAGSRGGGMNAAGRQVRPGAVPPLPK